MSEESIYLQKVQCYFRYYNLPYNLIFSNYSQDNLLFRVCLVKKIHHQYIYLEKWNIAS